MKDLSRSKNRLGRSKSGDLLKSNTLISLKKICKFLHIKNYSGLNKDSLILTINKYHATLKIQKWARKILSKDEICPISFESIKYPCFAFKTENNVLIYYNIQALRNFLIKTGDFRDPSTRVKYTDKQLFEIDSIYRYNLNLHPFNINSDNSSNFFKSVFQASRNYRFYERIKEKEQELLIFERILDSISNEIIELISENLNNETNILTFNSMYLHDYQIQFRRLINRSNSHAKYMINKNIDNFNQILTKEKTFNKIQFRTCEYVIIYLYQLREELY